MGNKAVEEFTNNVEKGIRTLEREAIALERITRARNAASKGSIINDDKVHSHINVGGKRRLI